MSVLKVTEVHAEEVAKNDEVVAGQVRVSRGEKGFVVLIVDTRGTYENADEEHPFIPVILNDRHAFKVGVRFRGNSADEIRALYPEILDAELTYKEAK